MLRSKNLFLNHSMDEFPALSNAARAEMELLAVDIEAVSVVQPGKYFSLTHASSLATLTSMVTYGIILLQFQDAGFWMVAYLWRGKEYIC